MEADKTGDASVSHDNIEGAQEAGKKRRSPNWGGPRPGAGRRPSILPPPIFLQLPVRLTAAEHEEAKRLSPGVRRHRLVREDDEAVRARAEAEAEEGSYVERERRQYNYRVLLEDLSEKFELLALDMRKRRWKLLSVPVDGDIEDTRPGRWRRGHDHDDSEEPD